MEEKQSFVKEIQSKHLITLSLSGVIGTGISLSSNYLIHRGSRSSRDYNRVPYWSIFSMSSYVMFRGAYSS